MAWTTGRGANFALKNWGKEDILSKYYWRKEDILSKGHRYYNWGSKAVCCSGFYYLVTVTWNALVGISIVKSLKKSL